MQILIVVDMQNDFIDGALGSHEAQAIVPAVKQRLDEAVSKHETIIFTQDTHSENYLNTAEGKKLPVPHCIKPTPGWEIHPDLKVASALIVEKPSFGSLALIDTLKKLEAQNTIESIELLGLCTDICVISNALLLKAAFSETPIRVNSKLCAGVSPQSHDNALKAMAMCQIDIL